jgi:hypothetical protein
MMNIMPTLGAQNPVAVFVLWGILVATCVSKSVSAILLWRIYGSHVDMFVKMLPW